MKKILLNILGASVFVLALAATPALAATETIVSDTSVKVIGVYNEASGSSVFVPTSQNAVVAAEPASYPTTYLVNAINSVWDNGVNWSFQTNSPTANWIWENKKAEDPATVYNSDDPLYDADASAHGRVVVFEKKFNIDGVPNSGTLNIAADNAYEVWVNGVFLDRSATAGGAGWETSNLYQASVATSGWQNVGHIPVTGLINGENTLKILAGNEYFGSDDGNNPVPALQSNPYAQYNPGAMIFSLDVEYNPNILGCIDQTATNYNPQATKDDGSCQYPPITCPVGTTQSDSPLETVIVNSSNASATPSTNSLTNGNSYLLVASGTWINLPYNKSDAEYTSTDDWGTHANGYDIDPWFLGEGEFDLQVNNAFINWGSYNPVHVYSYLYAGTGAPVNLGIFDGDSNTSTQNTGWYGDNEGSLSVDIYSCNPPAPQTGHIVVDKVTDPAQDSQSFTFTTGGTDYNGFSLANSDIPNDQTLNAGTYSVSEESVSGWDLTSATCLSSNQNDVETPASISLQAGETVTCIFTNTIQSSISGMKYNDKNRNGHKDSDEPGLPGWVIKLKVGNTVVDTEITDADGNYTFSNLAANTYKVRETPKIGWKRMSINPAPIVITDGSTVTGVNFGNAKKYKHEKEDTNRDCDRDERFGNYFANHGWSNYERDYDKKDHKFGFRR